MGCCQGANAVASVVPSLSSAIFLKLAAGSAGPPRQRRSLDRIDQPTLLASYSSLSLLRPHFCADYPPPTDCCLCTAFLYRYPLTSGDRCKRAWEGMPTAVVISQAVSDNSDGHLPLRLDVTMMAAGCRNRTLLLPAEVVGGGTGAPFCRLFSPMDIPSLPGTHCFSPRQMFETVLSWGKTVLSQGQINLVMSIPSLVMFRKKHISDVIEWHNLGDLHIMDHSRWGTSATRE